MSGRHVLLLGDTGHGSDGSLRENSPFDVVRAEAEEALGSATDSDERPACAVVGALEDLEGTLGDLRAAGVPAVVFADADPERMRTAAAAGANYVPADAADASELVWTTVEGLIEGGHAAPAEAERHLDRMTDAFFALDEAYRFTYLNDRAAELLDADPSALVGELVWDAFPEAKDTQFQAQYEAAMRTGEPVTFEEYFGPLDTWFSVTAYPSETGLSVYFRDVSERVEHGAELERRIHQQEMLSELGREAVTDVDTEAFFDAAVTRVAGTLDSACVLLCEYRKGENEFLVRAATGADCADERFPADGAFPDGSFDAEGSAGFDALSGCEFDGSVSVPVGADDPPWGALVACEGGEGFDAVDTAFLTSVANLVASTVERAAREREVERQRDHLALLAEFDAVVQDVIDNVTGAESREEIERFVCERIVEAEAVEFAWMGVTEGAGRTIVPSAAAGEGGDYAEEITVTTDTSPTGKGPSGQAAETGEVRVVNDIETDPDFEPWREAALERGFRSAAAIPLEHRDRLYGVLNVYADHGDAFPAEVQKVLTQLGQNLAHAMNALERRNALIADARVEVEFLIRDSGLFPALAASETGATLHLDGLVQRSEGGYVAYFAVEGVEPEAVAALAPADGATEANVVRADDEGGLVSVVLADAPLSNLLATHGAELVSVTATPDGLQTVARLPRSVDTRTVVEAVSDTFDGVEFRAKRTREPPDEGTEHPDASLEFDLTDRQREALESALRAGYFDWPRRSTGEAIAESMGITAPTFQEHLRTAQQKLLDKVFDAAVEDA
jgi:GAF domain-containing protein/PAS domain-containing protein